MKKYIKPATHVVAIEAQSILAASDISMHNELGGTQLGAEDHSIDFEDYFDDDYEW